MERLEYTGLGKKAMELFASGYLDKLEAGKFATLFIKIGINPENNFTN